MNDNIINKKLYEKVKTEITKKMPKSSAYRSGLIVQEYKRRGGKYRGQKPKSGLTSWFEKEKWVSVLDYLNGKIVPCSSSNTNACRPLKKGNRNILTIDEVIKRHGREKIKSLANKKKKNMNLTINWSKGTIG